MLIRLHSNYNFVRKTTTSIWNYKKKPPKNIKVASTLTWLNVTIPTKSIHFLKTQYSFPLRVLVNIILVSGTHNQTSFLKIKGDVSRASPALFFKYGVDKGVASYATKAPFTPERFYA